MSSEKWTARNSKADAVRGDRGLVIDSVDVNNKLMNVEDISRLQSAVKDYSNLLQYKIGDLVNFNGTLYKNIVAVTAPEDFDPAKWQDIVAGNKIVNVKTVSDFPDALPASFINVVTN